MRKKEKKICVQSPTLPGILSSIKLKNGDNKNLPFPETVFSRVKNNESFISLIWDNDQLTSRSWAFQISIKVSYPISH